MYIYIFEEDIYIHIYIIYIYIHIYIYIYVHIFAILAMLYFLLKIHTELNCFIQSRQLLSNC